MNVQIENFCNIIAHVIHPERSLELDANVDWNYMVQLAKEHSLLPLLMEVAGNYQSFHDSVNATLVRDESFAVIMMQVNRTRDFLDLYKKFIVADVHPIVMKGLICRQLYGKLCDHRASGDEDILIKPSEFLIVHKVMLQEGYKPLVHVQSETQLEWLQEVSYLHPEKKLYIEVHLNPMGRENDLHAAMSDCFLDVVNQCREVEVDGITVRTMSHQQHLLYLILHAFKHFTSGGVGIRQMLDILMYQEQYGPEIDMRKIHDELVQFQAHVLWSDFIYLGNQYFGFALPVILKPHCVNELFNDMIMCGTFGNRTEAEITAARTTMQMTGRGKRQSGNLLVVVMKSLFPSKEYMMFYSPYLEQKPWLLPWAWVNRWFRFVKKSFKNEGNLATDSLKISQRRMKLMKKYDLI